MFDSRQQSTVRQEPLENEQGKERPKRLTKPFDPIGHNVALVRLWR